MMYLNCVDQSEIQHGSTRFLTKYDGAETHRIVPSCGLCLCFRHDLFHNGEVLRSGLKYLMEMPEIMNPKFTLSGIPRLHFSASI
mmetsp:Transcript_6652/g.24893  ORF Transcript_6652/g.24893 Transcript_6652/m.24893 type:complete len:85 (+) Transcript_6652:1899-2153(+)